MKIGKRTKERIKERWTESDFFIREVWNVRPHECEECGKPLREPKAHNFDHIVGKWRDQSKRYDPANIRLLCYGCHHEKTFGWKYQGLSLDDI